jgi:hypothetical protein
VKINNLLKLLNDNELLQELINSNKLPIRFIYLFNICLKSLSRFIAYLLNYIKNKKD